MNLPSAPALALATGLLAPVCKGTELIPTPDLEAARQELRDSCNFLGGVFISNSTSAPHQIRTSYTMTSLDRTRPIHCQIEIDPSPLDSKGNRFEIRTTWLNQEDMDEATELWQERATLENWVTFALEDSRLDDQPVEIKAIFPGETGSTKHVSITRNIFEPANTETSHPRQTVPYSIHSDTEKNGELVITYRLVGRDGDLYVEQSEICDREGHVISPERRMSLGQDPCETWGYTEDIQPGPVDLAEWVTTPNAHSLGSISQDPRVSFDLE